LLSLFHEWGQMQLQAGLATVTEYDNRVLLSGRDFDGNTVGLAGVSTMCRQSSSGSVNMCGVLSGDVAMCAAVVAHEMGHNFGMHHDSSGNACPQSGLIMEAVGGGDASTQFSSCSNTYITSFFSETYLKNGLCLENTPSRVEGDPICGNGFVEKGEACDCGSSDCSTKDACCNGKTCQFADASYECAAAAGLCCESCKFVAAGAKKVCRAASGECDLAEYCPGGTDKCVRDDYFYPGKACTIAGFAGLCSTGRCESLYATCSVDIDRDFAGNWDQTEQCAAYVDSCGFVVCHNKDEASGYKCGQAFTTHGKQMKAPEGTPCWFPGSALNMRGGMCHDAACTLPFQLAIVPVCGNGGIDFGEECDCGTATSDACCECSTCKLKAGKKCSSSEACCDASCQFKAAGAECRAAIGTCDTAETCSGSSGVCPRDLGKKWGTDCTTADGGRSTCYGKVCLESINKQCHDKDSTKPFGDWQTDGVTPDEYHRCTALSCCTECSQKTGNYIVNGNAVKDPYLCDGCGRSSSSSTFTDADRNSNTIYLAAALDGTMLNDRTKVCVGAAPVTPAAQCSSGEYLAQAVGRCLACSTGCTACSGPTQFDCTGGCKYAQDSRGACATSAEQASFAATTATTIGAASGSPSPSPTPPSPSPSPTPPSPSPTPTPPSPSPSPTAPSPYPTPDESTTSTATTTTTVTPQTQEKVSFSLVVKNVSYEQLMALVDLLAQFLAKLRAVIAQAVGVPVDSVEITLSAGSVKVESTITPPASGNVTGANVTAMLSDDSKTAALATSVVNEVKTLPNISQAATGNITVEDISIPELVVVTLTVTTTTTKTTTPKGIASSSLLSASRPWWLLGGWICFTVAAVATFVAP